MTTAFVLWGGASHGAIQVGMLRALAERDIRPDLVFGASVGALNAACAYFATDPLDLTGILKALEIETTTIFSGSSGQAEVETWQLNHFSRYMLASG